jgi:iron complex outermembrane receptor protein
MNRGLFCGASVLTVAFFTTALASSAQAAAAAAPAATPAVSEVGEVVVTAEKRSTKLEKTPVAVTALTSQMRDLQGVSSVQDMTDVTPGMSYNTLANRPYMRGVGRNTDNLATESGVAVYSDGVYNGANASTLIQLDSLFTDRIDILRGPQSTLYGRNADGGAMNYVSKRPTNEFEAEGRVGADNYSKYYGEATVSGPITDNLKFRAGGSYASQTGGYYNNLDGKPVGGSIFQGGNGSDYHAEAQLQGNIGDTFDAWGKVATSDGNVSYVSSTLIGVYNYAQFNNSNSLSPNPLYGLCGTNAAGQSFAPNPTLGVGCPGASSLLAPLAQGSVSYDTLVPNSVVTGPNAVGYNPAIINSHTIDEGTEGFSNQGKNISLAAVLTWHLPGVDLKYTGGYQSFYYNLEFPSSAVNGDVLSYGLMGPATAYAGTQTTSATTGLRTTTPACSTLPGATTTTCTSPLTILPQGTHTYFIENESFYSHELNVTSTSNGPLQWIGGLYWYHENYDQPVGAMDSTQPQVYAPMYSPAQLQTGTGTASNNPAPASYNTSTTLYTAAPLNPLGCTYCEDTKLTADSYAGFGQVDWSINPQWKLTGGIRYTADHKFGVESFREVLFDASVFANRYGASTPAIDATPQPYRNAAGVAVPSGPGTGVQTMNTTTGFLQRNLDAWWSAWTGVAGVTWTPDNDTMAYARYSRGYKTGGFESGTMQIAPETLPELVDAYEVGFKEVFGHQLTFNAAGFYYNYSNDQQPLSVVNPNAPPATLTVVFNIPTAITYGVELETVWKPIDPLLISFNYTYLSSHVQNTGGQCFVDGSDPYAQMPGAKAGACAPIITGTTYTAQPQDLKGAELPQSPANKVSLNGIYTFKFEPGNLAISASYIWKDKEYASIYNRSYYFMPSYSQVNLRATWTDAKDRYTVFVFADNVFNANGYDGMGPYTLAKPIAPTLASGLPVAGTGTAPIIENAPSYTAPRTFGVEFQYRFR